MSADDSQNRYNPVSKGFHWVSALIVLALLPLGYFMTSLEFSQFKLDLYAWHKSFGTLLLILVALRILWRLRKGTPPHLETHARWEVALAKIVHVLLYVGLIGMPVSGWLMTSYGAFPHFFFGFNIPHTTGKDEQLFELMRQIHGLCAMGLIGAIVLHAAGAVKHHIIDRDMTMRRMLPDILPHFGVMVAVFALIFSLGFSWYFYALHRIGHDHSEHAGIMEVSENHNHDHDEVAVEAKSHTHVHDDGEVHVHDEAVEDEITLQSDVQGWAIVPEESAVGFTAKAQGAEFSGDFDDISGEILFDPENLEGSHVTVSVGIASVSTGSADRDGYMKAKDWLYESEYGRAKFEADQFSKTDNGYVAEGTLTMRGVSLPVSFPFTFTISGEGADRVAKAAGSFTINRLDYGVGAGDWASEKTASHQIEIAVTITATAI